MLLYLFFDYLLSTCSKKWKLKNGPRLTPLPYCFTLMSPEYCTDDHEHDDKGIDIAIHIRH